MSQSIDQAPGLSLDVGFAAAMAATSAGVTLSDAHQSDLPLVNVNAAFLRLTGYEESEVIGRNCRFLQGEETSANAKAALANALRERRGIKLRLLNYRRDGARFWNELTIDPIFGGDRQLTGFVGIQKDITAETEQTSQLNERIELLDATNHSLKSLLEDLEQQAYYDALTGVAGRRLFRDRLEQAIARCQRSKQSLAVLMMDLDGFKQVNDRHGHEAGDRVLRQVAERLGNQLREADTLARLGGDEFALIMEPGGERADVTTLATELARQRLLRAFMAPFLVEGGEVQLGISIGVALFPHDGRDADSLVHGADLAMYQDKRHHKLRVLSA